MGPWSLVACWCSPAFRDSHFTLGDADELIARYPSFEREIRALTR
jgi:predicted cupin superfamily sugar epimerase